MFVPRPFAWVVIWPFAFVVVWSVNVQLSYEEKITIHICAGEQDVEHTQDEDLFDFRVESRHSSEGRLLTLNFVSQLEFLN